MAHYTPDDFRRLEEAGSPIARLLAETNAALGGAVASPALPPTSPATPDPKRGGPMYWITFAGAVLLGLVAALSLWRVTQPAAPVPSPPAMQATPLPTIAATPAPTAHPALAPGLAVYFGPDGDAAPSVPVGTNAYTPTARYAGWIQLAIDGYAQPVWARADALPGVNVAALPAPYQPTPTPAPVVIRERVEVPITVLCTLDNATYRATRRNVQGSATAPSCTSQAEAEANAEALLMQQTGKGSQ